MTTTKSVLATLLVLASSTAAFAQPLVRDHREAPVQTVAVRDHRPASSYRDHQNFGHDRDHDGDRDWGRDHGRPVIVTPAPVVVQQPIDACANTRIGATASAYTGPVGAASAWGYWVNLTQPTMIGRGSEQITVGAAQGRFGTIQLVADGGGTYVKQVVVEFANGKYQTVALNQELDGRNPSLTIDLNGGKRAIARIIVEGTSGYGARYSIRAA